MNEQVDNELKILFLEDSASDTDLMLHELRNTGFQFTFERVSRREGFLLKLSVFAPSIIVADYKLPFFDGMSALSLSREKYPDIPFIFVSSTLGEERAIEAIKKGATDYVLKDKLSRLPLAINRALAEVEKKTALKKAVDELKQYQEQLEMLVKERTEKQMVAARKYAAILETTRNGFWLFDFTGKLLEVNDAYCRMSGYSRDELLTMYIQDIEAVETPGDIINHIEYIHHHGHDGYESRHRKKDGTLFDVEISANYLDVDEGRIVLFTWDITNRKRIEKFLRESEARFRSLTDNSPDIIQRFDTKLRYIYVNPAGLRINRIALDSLIGKTVDEVGTPKEPADLWKQKMKEVIQSGKPTKIEYPYPTHHGQRYYQTLITPEFDNAGKVISLLAVTRDISELKRVEKIKDDFIGMVSHELRTPLTVLIGAIKVAMSEGLTTEDMKSLLQDADYEADYLSILLSNLLELSHVQARRFTISKTQTDIEMFLWSLIAERRKQFPAYKFTLDIDKILPLIEIDPIRVSLVMKNLINNAVKYSPRNSEIRVIASHKSHYLQIGVVDHGKGIAREDQPKLFQSFERLRETSTTTPGLGLGLLVCQRMVEAHEGQIWVESEVGKGSTFWFTLPCSQ